MKVKILLLCIIMLMFSGCQNPEQSKASLIKDPAIKYELTIDKNYQEVYRVCKAELEKKKGVWVGNSWVVDAELYTDIHRGEISFQLLNALLGAVTYVYVDITQVEGDTSQVVIYSHPLYSTFSTELKEKLIK